MIKPKGGRGCKAPYETQQMRVPVPIKDRVNELITRYRDWVLEPDGDLASCDEALPKLKALEDEIKSLKRALVIAQSEVQKLNGSKEVKIGDRMKEREFVRFFDVGERVFRTPREKKEKAVVQIQKRGKLITLEHYSEKKRQDGITSHYWTITDVENA